MDVPIHCALCRTGTERSAVFTVLARVAELKWVSVAETSWNLGTRGYFRVASHNQCHSASAGVLIGCLVRVSCRQYQRRRKASVSRP